MPPHVWSPDALHRARTLANHQRGQAEKDFRRHQAREKEALKDCQDADEQHAKRMRRLAELEEARRSADKSAQNALQRVAEMDKEIKLEGIRQEQSKREVEESRKRAQYANDRMVQSAIDYDLAGRRKRAADALEHARVEHDVNMGKELLYNSRKRESQRQIEANAAELTRLMEQREDITTDDECGADDTQRPAGLLVQQPASTEHSPSCLTRYTTAVECKDHQWIYDRRERQPAPSWQTHKMRGTAGEGGKPNPKKENTIKREDEMGRKRPRSEPGSPQLRTPPRRQVSAKNFFACISTAALYPETGRSEIESWLNHTATKAHVICVHFIGDTKSFQTQKKILIKVVAASERFAMHGAPMAPMSLLYQKQYNKVRYASFKRGMESHHRRSPISSAVFEISRRIQGEWAAPYAVGIVQATPTTTEGATEFKDTMRFFHDERVTFVSVHGVTTSMVHGFKANLMLCNPLWRETHGDTAVADIEREMEGKFMAYRTDTELPPGGWEYAAMPHYLLSFADVICGTKVPPLQECPHVDVAMELGTKCCGLHKLPAISPTGPPVTFPTGMTMVDLSGDEDTAHIAAQNRQQVHRIKKVYQGFPHFFRTLHVIQAVFGTFEAEKY